jgi:hypothetical protein
VTASNPTLTRILLFLIELFEYLTTDHVPSILTQEFSFYRSLAKSLLLTEVF